jgi:hypothetical protein
MSPDGDTMRNCHAEKCPPRAEWTCSGPNNIHRTVKMGCSDMTAYHLPPVLLDTVWIVYHTTTECRIVIFTSRSRRGRCLAHMANHRVMSKHPCFVQYIRHSRIPLMSLRENQSRGPTATRAFRMCATHHRLLRWIGMHPDGMDTWTGQRR